MKKCSVDYSTLFLATIVPYSYPIGPQLFQRANSRYKKSVHPKISVPRGSAPVSVPNLVNNALAKVPTTAIPEQELLDRLLVAHGQNLLDAFREAQQIFYKPVGSGYPSQLSSKVTELVEEKLVRTMQGVNFRSSLDIALEKAHAALTPLGNVKEIEPYISANSITADLSLVVNKEWIRKLVPHPYDPQGFYLVVQTDRALSTSISAAKDLHEILEETEEIKKALSAHFTIY